MNERRINRRVVLGGTLSAAGVVGMVGTGCAVGDGGAGRGVGRRRARLTDALAGADVSAVVRWNEAALQAIRTVRPAPTVSARALAVLHTCIFDAWAAYDAVALGTQRGGAFRQPPSQRTPAQRREAVSVAAHRALVDLFPSATPTFDAVLVDLGYPAAGADGTAGTAPEDDGAPRTPRQVGLAAAGAVLEARRGDGANQAGGYRDTTGYAPANTPDSVQHSQRWQPLRVPDGNGGSRIQECATPHWGLVRPFALSDGARLRPKQAPHPYPSAGYRAQAIGLLDLSAGLDDRRKVTAEYWADGPATETPPGHWCLLARFVSWRDGHDLDADVQLYFALANALLDAGIAAWDAKCHFDYVRPITAIRSLFGGRSVRAWRGPYLDTGLLDGSQWHPYQPADSVTPPFPEFVSGHSTFSAAAAEVLEQFTASDTFGATVTVAAGSSRIEPGRTPAADVTLSWDTFSDAAVEAGMSRRYGGIHFEDGDLQGRVMGRAAGKATWARAQAYIKGTA